MDSGTHLVMGLGLYGLAHLDPAISQNTNMLYAALLGTVIGSQIPDIDTLYRIKGNAVYVRNHRGWTHSLPMNFIWPTLITFILSLFISISSPLTIWLWTCLAVFIHIAIDCFNTYGTQALRPVKSTWVSLNIINIFDPVIFGLHVVGILVCLVIPKNSGLIFAIIESIFVLYIISRTIYHYMLTNWVMNFVKESGRYTVIPTFRLHVWHVIVEFDGVVKMGEIRNKSIKWIGSISNQNQNQTAIEKSKESEAVASFLFFTSYGYPLVKERAAGYEVRWLDVRYFHKKQFPFVAFALLDHNYQIIRSFVGWHSEKRTKKKVAKYPIK